MQESFKIPSATYPTLTGSIVTFNAQYALPLKSHTVALTATQSGSGTPSPSSPLPISGWDAINIGATGKNILNPSDMPPFANQTPTAMWGTNFNTFTNFIKSLPIGYRYYISLDYEITQLSTGTNKSYGFLFQGLSSSHMRSDYDDRYVGQVIHFETYFDMADTFAGPAYWYSANDTVLIKNLQIEVGSSATAYEPYNGTYTTIQLGDTIYGGEYDARSGVFIATHKGVDLGSLTWTSGTPHIFTTNISDKGKGSNMLSSSYKVVYKISSNLLNYEISGLSVAGVVNVRNDDYSDANIFKTDMSGQKLVYELATPQTIQLPPCPIDTLEGVNNIWADTGDTTLQYPKFG